MTELASLDGLEAAKRMAAISPETQAKFDECMSMGWTQPERVTAAFHAIGAAIGSERTPVSGANKRKLFAFAEQLLTQGSGKVSNAVATCMLEQIWTAAHESGFDFAAVDPYLGPQSRSYLIAWDDFHKVKTAGLTRK